jgi:pimeloyl-ACP methyl ester carboxylesterase
VLPGFYGSKLSASAHDRLVWLDIAGLTDPRGTMDALRFDAADPNRLQATGILDEVNVIPFFWSVDIYRKFLSFLRDNLHLQVYEFWFDWRRSLGDSTDQLQRRISRVLQETGARKVSLLAHSQGGLVARACIAQYDLAAQIDWLVTFGTPHKGMLKTFKAVSQGLPVFTFSAAQTKATSRTLPAAYELLPSDATDGLFTWNGTAQSALEVPDWCQTQPMKDLLRGAGTVIGGLPREVPVRSAFFYGTRLPTTVKATGDAGGLTFLDSEDGDSTVPEVSARGDGLTGEQLLRIAVPLCDHLLLFDHEQARQNVLTPILLGRPLPDAYLLTSFPPSSFFVPRQRKRLVAAVQDTAGTPIAGADVRLSILGTGINDQPVPEQPGRRDYVLDVVMPPRGGGYRFTVEVHLPGGRPTLRQQGLLVATQS